MSPSAVKSKVFITKKMKMIMKKCCTKSAALIACLVLVSSIMGLAEAASKGGLQSEDSAPPNKVQKCREGCLDKVRGSFFILIVFRSSGNCVYIK